MTDYRIVYITHESEMAAKELGNKLMSERLIACYNVISNVDTACFWPPMSNQLEKSREVVLICKTHVSKFSQIEVVVNKLHSYDVPCIIELPISNISKAYEDWLKNELQIKT